MARYQLDISNLGPESIRESLSNYDINNLYSQAPNIGLLNELVGDDGVVTDPDKFIAAFGNPMNGWGGTINIGTGGGVSGPNAGQQDVGYDVNGPIYQPPAPAPVPTPNWTPGTPTPDVNLQAEVQADLERIRREAEAALAEKARQEAAEAERIRQEQAAAAQAAEAERIRLEQEQAAAAEAERVRQEQAAAAAEAERILQEEAIAAEVARLRQEQAAALEAERILREQAAAAAEESERQRLEAEAEAERLRQQLAVEEAERIRREAEAAEQARQQAEAAERARQEAEEAARQQQEQEAAEAAEAAERARQEQEAAVAAERARVEQEAAAEAARLNDLEATLLGDINALFGDETAFEDLIAQYPDLAGRPGIAAAVASRRSALDAREQEIIQTILDANGTDYAADLLSNPYYAELQSVQDAMAAAQSEQDQIEYQTDLNELLPRIQSLPGTEGLQELLTEMPWLAGDPLVLAAIQKAEREQELMTTPQMGGVYQPLFQEETPGVGELYTINENGEIVPRLPNVSIVTDSNGNPIGAINQDLIEEAVNAAIEEAGGDASSLPEDSEVEVYESEEDVPEKVPEWARVTVSGGSGDGNGRIAIPRFIIDIFSGGGETVEAGEMGWWEEWGKDLVGAGGAAASAAINVEGIKEASENQLAGIREALAMQEGQFDAVRESLKPFIDVGADQSVLDAITQNILSDERFQGENLMERLPEFNKPALPGDLNAAPALGEQAVTGVGQFDPQLSQIFQLASGSGPLTIGDSAAGVSVTPGGMSANGPVSVNEFNPFDANDPVLQFLQNESRKAIEQSALSEGFLNSGGTAAALVDRAQNVALTNADRVQNIMSQRDQLSLAANQQDFAQRLDAANFNFSSASQYRDQLSGEDRQKFELEAAKRGIVFNENEAKNKASLQQRAQEFTEQLTKNQANFEQEMAFRAQLNAEEQQLYDILRANRSQLMSEAITDFQSAQQVFENVYQINAQDFMQEFNLDQQEFENLAKVMVASANAAAGQATNATAFANASADLTALGGIASGNAAANEYGAIAKGLTDILTVLDII